MEKRYYTLFFEKLTLAASQKAPLFNQVALSLNKLAFISEESFVEEMYRVAFNHNDNEEILRRLGSTFAPSESTKKWVYCELCKELAIAMHSYSAKIDKLINSIAYARIRLAPQQINFLKKSFPDFKNQIKRLEKVKPVETFFTPHFLEENREKFQHYYRQLQCYDFLYTQHNFLCDWEFSDISFEKFVVKLCCSRPELFDKIYFRMRFDMHKAIFIMFKTSCFSKFSGLDVLKFESAIGDAIGTDTNGENYKLLEGVTEYIIHNPNICPLLYQLAALSDEEKLKNHTFTSEIITNTCIDQYLQLLFLIISSSPSSNVGKLIDTFLKPIIEKEEVFKEHLSVAVLSSRINIIPSLYKRGIECFIEYLEAFR